MEKEDQIEKVIPSSNSNRESSKKATKERSLTSNPFPALDFVKIEKEIIRATEDV